MEFILRRETLDGDLIRLFALKIIFRFLVDLRGVRDQAAMAWVRRLEFLEFPIFWSWFIVAAGGRIILGFGLQHLL